MGRKDQTGINEGMRNLGDQCLLLVFDPVKEGGGLAREE